uniref:Uncharacterized protein n=1 Tax=Arundo donax TaxID=35708 RepID=A0A0A9CPY5_ARUDO
MSCNWFSSFSLSCIENTLRAAESEVSSVAFFVNTAIWSSNCCFSVSREAMRDCSSDNFCCCCCLSRDSSANFCCSCCLSSDSCFS